MMESCSSIRQGPHEDFLGAVLKCSVEQAAQADREEEARRQAQEALTKKEEEAAARR